MRSLSSRLAALALGAGAAAGGLVVVGAPPAHAEPADCSSIEPDSGASDPVSTPSLPLVQLRIPEAQYLVRDLTGKEPGQGVRVAVVDSGVETGSPSNFRDPMDPELPIQDIQGGPTASWHGTAVAGVVLGKRLAQPVGPIGIAPAADWISVRAYDVGEEGQEGDPITANRLAEALELVAALPADQTPDVVVAAVAVPEDVPRLREAVGRVTEKSILVVPAGNRPTEESPLSDDVGPYEPGEDVADLVFPAGYAADDPMVVVASSTVEGAEATAAVLQNSLTSVAVPTTMAASYGLNGVSCVVATPSTSMAAAEVAGILALLRTRWADDTPRELVSRLEETAAGPEVRLDEEGQELRADKLIGHGIAQPVEALTRPLRFEADGTVARGAPPVFAIDPAVVPPTPPDVLAPARHDALWWGLIGGGVLVIALLVRPVLRRR